MLLRLVIRSVCVGIGGTSSPSERAIQRITETLLRDRTMKKPMQVAGCVVWLLSRSCVGFGVEAWVIGVCKTAEERQLDMHLSGSKSVATTLDRHVCDGAVLSL